MQDLQQDLSDKGDELQRVAGAKERTEKVLLVLRVT